MKPQKLMTRGDLVVMLGLAILLPLLYWQLWQDASPGARVQVLVDGKAYAEVSLQEDLRLTVPGRVGVSVIRVEHGRARFAASPCAGKQCIHSGWITSGGEMVACVPNGVVLVALGSTQRYDSIVF